MGVFSLRNSTQAKLSVLQPDMTCGSVACTRNGRDTTGNTIFIYSRLEFKMAIGTSTQCKAQCVARLAWWYELWLCHCSSFFIFKIKAGGGRILLCRYGWIIVLHTISSRRMFTLLMIVFICHLMLVAWLTDARMWSWRTEKCLTGNYNMSFVAGTWTLQPCDSISPVRVIDLNLQVPRALMQRSEPLIVDFFFLLRKVQLWISKSKKTAKLPWKRKMTWI